MNRIQPSPSRTYVAILISYTKNDDPNYLDSDGKMKDWIGTRKFRKFVLPKHGRTEGWTDEQGIWQEGSYSRIFENSCSAASWYFLNELNLVACIQECIPYEHYLNLEDQDEINRRRDEELRKEVNQAKGYEI